MPVPADCLNSRDAARGEEGTRGALEKSDPVEAEAAARNAPAGEAVRQLRVPKEGAVKARTAACSCS